MINRKIEKLLLKDKSKIMIPSESVANVRVENTLLHATMILSNVGYSSIPVLDNQHHLVGIITMPKIIEGINDQITYNWDQLSEKRVEDIVCDDYSVAHKDASIEEILNLLIDHNYVCIVDEDQVFQGIITRKSILERVNNLVHEIDKKYELLPKKKLKKQNKPTVAR